MKKEIKTALLSAWWEKNCECDKSLKDLFARQIHSYILRTRLRYFICVLIILILGASYIWDIIPDTTVTNITLIVLSLIGLTTYLIPAHEKKAVELYLTDMNQLKKLYKISRTGISCSTYSQCVEGVNKGLDVIKDELGWRRKFLENASSQNQANKDSNLKRILTLEERHRYFSNAVRAFGITHQ